VLGIVFLFKTFAEMFVGTPTDVTLSISLFRDITVRVRVTVQRKTNVDFIVTLYVISVITP